MISLIPQNDNLKFQIKHTMCNMLTADQQRPYQHSSQVKSHLSGSSSSPGHSQLLAEPFTAVAKVLRVKGHVLAPPCFHTPINTHLEVWVELREGLRTEAAMERPRGGH